MIMANFKLLIQHPPEGTEKNYCQNNQFQSLRFIPYITVI
jgi:hypothetical protein